MQSIMYLLATPDYILYLNEVAMFAYDGVLCNICTDDTDNAGQMKRRKDIEIVEITSE